MLIACLSLPASANTATIEQNFENTIQFDELDLWLTVGIHILSENKNDNSPWDPSTYIVQYEPLYNLNKEIIAYYVTLSSGGYMVVNANKYNPIVLEFGYGKENAVTWLNSAVSERSFESDNAIYYLGNSSHEPISRGARHSQFY